MSKRTLTSRRLHERAAHVRDFVHFVQASVSEREITRAVLVHLYRDFAKTRQDDELTQRQLDKALSANGVTSRQVDVRPGDGRGYNRNKTGRQRVRLYQIPRRRSGAQGVTVPQPAPSVPATLADVPSGPMLVAQAPQVSGASVFGKVAGILIASGLLTVATAGAAMSPEPVVPACSTAPAVPDSLPGASLAPKHLRRAWITTFPALSAVRIEARASAAAALMVEIDGERARIVGRAA